VNHKDLDVWKQAITLVLEIYKLSSSFPKDETYGLIPQIRRAAVSIPSNISEGAARNSKKEFLNFLNFSLGSLAEVETQLIIAKRLSYCNIESTMKQINRVRWFAKPSTKGVMCEA